MRDLSLLPYLEDIDLTNFLEQLQDKSLLFDLHVVSSEDTPARKCNCPVVFQGQIQIDGKWCTLHIGLARDFPLSLPNIFLIPWNTFGVIPHVGVDGQICYLRKEGVLLNRRAPAKIILEAVQRSIEVLISGDRRTNQQDFIEEFETYWFLCENAEVSLSLVKPGRDIKELLAFRKLGDHHIVLIGDEDTLQKYPFKVSKSYKTCRGLYVPLKKGPGIMPPTPNSMWSLNYIQSMIRLHLSTKRYRKLKRLVQKFNNEEIVVFGLPRPSGNTGLFGIYFQGVEKQHPLLSGGSVQRMIPLTLMRQDQDYLLPRGGSNKTLQSKEVALIGCGAVGSPIAVELVKAGILNLTLVDHDTLEPENTFRHILGRDNWGKPKVVGLKTEIERKYPFVNIQTIEDRVERRLNDDTFLPKNYDMIIIAIGDDTLSLHLNEVLFSMTQCPPVIYTWVEPYGIGGHALVVGHDKSRGCFECLFTPPPKDSPGELYNRAAFAAPNQTFSKDLSGCGNPFTPYGSYDAMRTALITSHLAVDVLLGREVGNPLLSWKGNPEEFIGAGFELSERFDLNEQELFKRKYDYINPDCLICGKIV